MAWTGRVGQVDRWMSRWKDDRWKGRWVKVDNGGS